MTDLFGRVFVDGVEVSAHNSAVHSIFLEQLDTQRKLILTELCSVVQRLEVSVYNAYGQVTLPLIVLWFLRRKPNVRD